jgi:hypothetical protein
MKCCFSSVESLSQKKETMEAACKNYLWVCFMTSHERMSKKLKKPIKLWKLKKKNWKNRTIKKPIKILKKPTGSVWFRFYKPKTEPNRTEPKQKKTEKKPSQNPNRKNWAKPVWIGFCPKKPNRNKSIWTSFCSVSVLF